MIYIANLFLAYCFCLTKKSSLNKTVVIQVKLSEEIKMSALFDLTGKTALVTGSARGLGFAYAEGLAVAGARVILNDIRETLLAESVDVLASKGYSAHGAAFDVTSEDAIEKAFSKLDAQGIHVDILINNAGIQYRKPMVELELENSLRSLRRTCGDSINGGFHPPNRNDCTSGYGRKPDNLAGLCHAGQRN